MTAELFQQISAHGAAVNLSSRTKLRLTGADRVRYLNGQVTNDVRQVKPTETLYACVTDVKGRIAGDVFAHAEGESLLLDAEEGLRETLSMRLERYIVADDVELADVTEEWQLWHVWGDEGTPARIEAVLSGQECPHHLLQSTRYGVPGIDLWLPASAPAPTFTPLPVLTDAALETWRILQKIPRWPHELNAETFPPEAGLESKAMNFSKGCYIGQEVLSRIKTTGKMPREMIAWQMQKQGDIVKVGDVIRGVPNSANLSSIGIVTSVTIGPETGKHCGLGFVKQGAKFDMLQLPSGFAQRC